MLMGYIDSSTWSEPQIQPDLTDARQYEDADDPIAAQLQSEAPVADPQKSGHMPELVASDDEDDGIFMQAAVLTLREKMTPNL